MKKIIIPPVFLFALMLGATLLHAAREGGFGASAVYDDGGNNATILAVPKATETPVIISSSPVGSGLGIAVWRFREIYNCSNGKLLILPNATQFTTFSSTVGVVLSSDTTGGFAGDSYVVPHQGVVYGIWSPLTTTGGACGGETYWDEKKKDR